MENALPSIMLGLLVFSSNLYYKERFDTPITVNVTCLLALSGTKLNMKYAAFKKSKKKLSNLVYIILTKVFSGIFIAILQSLPKTPETKVIDLLLIKCISMSILLTLLQIIHVQSGMLIKICNQTLNKEYKVFTTIENTLYS